MSDRSDALIAAVRRISHDRRCDDAAAHEALSVLLEMVIDRDQIIARQRRQLASLRAQLRAVFESR